MSLAKSAVIINLTGVAFLFVYLFSVIHGDLDNTPLTDILASILNFDRPLDKVENTVKAAGLFDINEPNLKKALLLLAIILSICAGILSLLSALRNEDSLGYSIAIFLSSSILFTIQPIISGIFLVTTVFIIMNHRRWKMTRN